jgi:type I restriction enzyme S subunit
LDHASDGLGALRKSWRALEVAGGQSVLKPGSPLNVDWRWGRLGDLIDKIQAGKSFTCEPRRAREGEWGVIKVSAMTWGEFRDGENKAVPHDQPIDPRNEIWPGDILVSRANTEAYVGAPVLVRDCRPRLLLSDKSLRLIPKEGVNKEWLLQVLASPLVRRQISAASTGNQESMRNISQSALSAIAIPIPPAHVMEVVADGLRDASSVIHRQEDQVEKARRRCEALRRAILTTALTGRLVTRDQAPRTEMHAEGSEFISGHERVLAPIASERKGSAW